MCSVARIENAITGKNNTSIPDLWVFCVGTQWGGWVELKAPKGRPSDGQIEFRNNCLECGVNHIFAYKLEDLKEIFSYEEII